MHLSLSTVFWGEWHTDAFLSHCLPTMLAAGNLPALGAAFDVTYEITVPDAELRKLRASPLFPALEKCVDLKLRSLDAYTNIDRIQVHNQIWRAHAEFARAHGDFSMFLPPDVVWSNNSMRHFADLLARGKKVIFLGMPRVVSETFLTSFTETFPADDDATISAQPRDLVALSMEHAHPLWFTFDRNSAHFPFHPELINWLIEGEGTLTRFLCREMFIFKADEFSINDCHLPAGFEQPEDFHFVTDSDEACAISLARFAQDPDWYATPQTLDIHAVGSWWLRFDSPANDWTSTHDVHFKATEPTPIKWRRAHASARDLLRRIRTSRNIQRFIEEFRAFGDETVTEVVSLALFEADLVQHLSSARPVRVLMPTRQAANRWMSDSDKSILEAGNEAALRDLIFRHIVVDTEHDDDQEVMHTLGGEAYTVDWKTPYPTIDGARITKTIISLDSVDYYFLDTVLSAAS